VSLLDFLRGSRPPLVEQGLRDLGQMIATAGEMFAAATAHLLDNEPLTLNLAAADERVNDLEREIRRAVFKHVVINPRDELTLSLLLPRWCRTRSAWATSRNRWRRRPH